MLKTLGLVEVCSSVELSQNASVLRSLASRRLGSISLLEWVVRRVTECQTLEGIVVVAADDPACHRMLQLVPFDSATFISSATDPLARAAAAIEEFEPEAIVRISLTSPFVDPEFIDRLVVSAEANRIYDYVSFCSKQGRSALQSKIGLFGEWCRAEAVLKANAEAVHGIERQSATSFIYSHPELFQIRLLPIPNLLDRSDLRLSIDSEEDWEHAQVIFDALGPEHLDSRRIARLLEQNPAIRERMAVLNENS